MLIYILINYTDKSYEKIKEAVDLNLIKVERNRLIINTLFEKIKENNNISNMENVLDWFNDEDIVNYISGILAYDFEINDVDKAIEDIQKIYIKEKKIARRNEIINQLENKELQEEEKAKLGQELSNIIIELARIK